MTTHAAVQPRTHGLVLQPDWIVPIESPAIAKGFLVAVAGSIEFLGAELPERFESLPRVRLENTAILPGWVNSHCHLEFSDLVAPIPAEGPFDRWLSRVIEQRASLSTLSIEQRIEQRRNAIRQGLNESWQHGVRWIVDNVTAPWDPSWIAEFQSRTRKTLHPLAASALVPDTIVSVQPCFELIDVQDQRWQQTTAFAFEQIDAPKYLGVETPGLAPHAPYTASQRVTRHAAEWSRDHQGLISMHLAETDEELQWLDARSGSLGAWIGPKTDAIHRENLGTIDEHLSILGTAWRSLVIHGNYLRKDQIDFLSKHRDRMAVVYCPRTHAWFDHSEHPMLELNSRGVPVLLGTDSRASNPNLNLWEEVRHVASSSSAMDRIALARRITSDASHFLQLPRSIGRLEIGAASSLTALHWEVSDENATGLGDSERMLWDWMVRCGTPYPLEIDPRLDRPAAS
jgi:cytosine/adenosine deaminase-related metal-dependent hydrolase